MVNGLQTFQRHFAAFQDTYLLIGGCACDIHFEAFDLPFRAYADDLPDPAALGVPMTSENLLHTLRTLFSSAAGA